MAFVCAIGPVKRATEHSNNEPFVLPRTARSVARLFVASRSTPDPPLSGSRCRPFLLLHPQHAKHHHHLIVRTVSALPYPPILGRPACPPGNSPCPLPQHQHQPHARDTRRPQPGHSIRVCHRRVPRRPPGATRRFTGICIGLSECGCLMWCCNISTDKSMATDTTCMPLRIGALTEHPLPHNNH